MIREWKEGTGKVSSNTNLRQTSSPKGIYLRQTGVGVRDWRSRHETQEKNECNNDAHISVVVSWWQHGCRIPECAEYQECIEYRVTRLEPQA